MIAVLVLVLAPGMTVLKPAERPVAMPRLPSYGVRSAFG